MTAFPADDTPRNKEAEDALIGSILVSPEYFRECSAIVNPADFWQTHWNHVWKAFAELDKQGKPIDSLTVMDQLDKSQCNGDVTAVDLIEAMQSCPVSRNAPTYAEAVVESAGKRRLLMYASDVWRMALDGSCGFLEALEATNKALAELPVRQAGALDLTGQLSALYDTVDARRKDPKEVWGIPIGVPRIDKAMGGLQRGELTIIAGQPKLGKSMFAGQTACYGASRGYHCGIYSLEMRNEQILRRQIANLTGIDTKSIKSGSLSDSEWAAFVAASSELSKLPLFIVDDSSLTLEQIRADIYRRSKERPVDFVVVDYIGLINDPEPDDNVRENNITKGLKRLADKENVAVLAIHSMNKEGLGQNIPRLSSVSGPAKNVYNADNIMFFLEHIPERGCESNANMRTLYCKAMRDAPGLHFVHLQRMLGKPGFEAVPDFPVPDYELPDWTNH